MKPLSFFKGLIISIFYIVGSWGVLFSLYLAYIDMVVAETCQADGLLKTFLWEIIIIFLLLTVLYYSIMYNKKIKAHIHEDPYLIIKNYGEIIIKILFGLMFVSFLILVYTTFKVYSLLKLNGNCLMDYWKNALHEGLIYGGILLIIITFFLILTNKIKKNSK